MRKKIIFCIIIIGLVILAVTSVKRNFNKGNETYLIVYNTNTLDVVDNVPQNSLKLKDEEFLITNYEPKRQGYTFLSWNTQSNGNGIKYEFIDTYNENKNLVLYAQWQKDKSVVPNQPILGDNMVPIYWNENNEEVEMAKDNIDISLWYLYDSSTKKFGNDFQESRWANAKTTDGSYWVWIPSFAYKIIYYTDNTYTKLSENETLYGKIKIEFVRDEEEISESYKLHHAFSIEDIAINGFWVAKFEMSREDRLNNQWKQTNNFMGNIPTNNNIRLVSKPGVAPWTYISSSYMFENSLDYNPKMKSHMMKNSEWGAVAYLTWSSYGRNGQEITINNYYNKSLKTGHGATDVSVPTTSIYSQYNTRQSVMASTTGNCYGIYDMSGGANEYVAAFSKSGNSNNLQNDIGIKQFAGSIYLASIETPQFVDVYEGTEIYNSGYGDAVYETLMWNNDHGRFPANEYCVFKRGGIYDVTAFAGVFCFYGGRGTYTNVNSFRVVLWY